MRFSAQFQISSEIIEGNDAVIATRQAQSEAFSTEPPIRGEVLKKTNQDSTIGLSGSIQIEKACLSKEAGLALTLTNTELIANDLKGFINGLANDDLMTFIPVADCMID